LLLHLNLSASLDFFLKLELPFPLLLSQKCGIGRRF
jgi:hypothetical protein